MVVPLPSTPYRILKVLADEKVRPYVNNPGNLVGRYRDRARFPGRQFVAFDVDGLLTTDLS